MKGLRELKGLCEFEIGTCNPYFIGIRWVDVSQIRQTNRRQFGSHWLTEVVLSTGCAFYCMELPSQIFEKN